MAAPTSARPVCLLLLPRTLEQFLLRDQAEDLLTAPGVVAIEPARVPYGLYLRLGELIGDALADRLAKRLVKALHRTGAQPRVVTIFHPAQVPLAQAVVRLCPEAELWYGRWDRYEEAYDASPTRRVVLERLHTRAAEASALTFVVNDVLGDLEREAGREATLVPLAADSFPAPDPGASVVAVSLGHLGWRTDWALLRAVAERMPELVLLLVGAWHEDEVGGDEDFAACRAAPNLVWLGARSDEEAARLILCADVGIVPFAATAFNDAGLPFRILKYARLGRRTVSPPLAGARTWAHAVDFADDADAFVAALRAQAGARTRPAVELRAWALGQTARDVNAPLWERLAALGVATR